MGISKSSSYPGETSDVRILRKLNRSRSRYIADRIKSHDPWLPTRKLPRLLTTSASAIRKIQRMGVLQGIDVERQQRQELQLMAVAEVRKNIPHSKNQFEMIMKSRQKIRIKAQD